MSRFNLVKKLQPAKKAWKSFTRSLQSKLRKFNICKTIKTTKKHCFTALQTIRSSISRKLCALTRRSTMSRRYHSHHHNHQFHHLRKSNATIYIDELFPKPRHDVSLVQPSKANEIFASSSGVSKAKTEMTKNVEKKQQNGNVATSSVKILDGNKGGQTSKSVVADKWKLPQFRGIDERAEEFISNFREEMKLQREQSILEFQEMLDRSA